MKDEDEYEKRTVLAIKILALSKVFFFFFILRFEFIWVYFWSAHDHDDVFATLPPPSIYFIKWTVFLQRNNNDDNDND